MLVSARGDTVWLEGSHRIRPMNPWFQRDGILDPIEGYISHMGEQNQPSILDD
jgi:hypothetical protein